ncbi:MAG: hypothetical protein H7338_08155 [Candidatus Sericytochromatia bacterium]|nr:hypothetical protein [Candidatus Sericytochromatia bacterium]
MLPSLEQVLAYRHDGVIRNFQRNFPHLESVAPQLFTEMIRFLWLSRKHESDLQAQPEAAHLNFLFVMHTEMLDIDNMWHAFILYTKDYMAFCETYFGEYMHHEPDVAETEPQTPEEFAVDLGLFLSYTYDTLGEVTVRRWFGSHLLDQDAEAVAA